MDAAPFLNLIIAPNGSGKSALVCGMIVGLAGDVSLTGRSGNLSDYIKFGCDTGYTDIELISGPGRNHRIQRKLNKTVKEDGSCGCRSEWLLNGKTSTEKEVKAFVKSLNIAIDNLCQCLPQERVVEFVKMNSKELLQNTEKAVADVSLYNDHQLLMDLSDRVKSLRDETEKLSGKTMEKEKQNERDEEEIKRLEEKKKVKEEIRSLELKRPWIEFEAMRQRFVAAKAECETLMKKKKKEESLIQPYLHKVTECSQSVKQADKTVSQLQKEIETLSDNCKKLVPRVNQSVRKADELVQEFKSKVSDNSNRQGQIVVLKSKIRDLENDLNNRDSEQDLEQTIASLDDKMQAASTSITDLTNKKEALAGDLSRMTDSLKRLQSRMQALDTDNRRRQLLRQQNQSAYNGLQVLEDMRRANAFSEAVYPPLMLVIDIDDMTKSKFVESCISKRDLFAFLFEDDGDLLKFSQELAARNIRCALIRVPPAQNRPQVSASRLRRLGFETLVTDLFQAPPAVKHYLHVQHNVDRIPVGGEDVSSRIDECDQMGITSFFAGSDRYSMTKSRYDGSVVTISNPVQDAKFLTIAADVNSVQQVRDQMSDLEERIASGRTESEKIAESLRRKEDDKMKIREEKKVHTNMLQDIRQMRTTLSLRRQELATTESATFDEVAEKAALLSALRIESQKSGKLVNELKQQHVASVEKSRSKIVASCHLISMRKRLNEAKKRSEQASARLKNLEQELEIKDKEKNDVKTRAKQMRHAAEQKVINAGYKMRNSEVPEVVRKLFDKLPDDVHEVDAKLETLYLKIQSMTGVESESAVQDFENRKREIEENRKQLQRLSAELERRQSEMESVKERWMRPLKELMQRIDENFSRAMRCMGHAGDVQLRGEGVSVIFSEFNFCDHMSDVFVLIRTSSVTTGL
jgi:chromosome segregation ATPase